MSERTTDLVPSAGAAPLGGSQTGAPAARRAVPAFHRRGGPLRLEPLAHRVIVSWGWRRAALAAAAGALSVLAMAPFHLAPVLFLTLPVLVWLIDGAGGGTRIGAAVSAGVAGWWFGLGYFLVGLHWIGSAFLVEREVFGWMMPFAVGGLAGGLALFYALGTALARLLWSPGPARVAALAFGLGCSEWLRGHLLTGFPWNALGQAFSATEASTQAAALFGLHGLTVLAVAIFASPAALVGAGRGVKRWPLALALSGLALILAGGGFRLWTALPDTVPGTRLRLVQPNIDQREKFRPELRDEVMDTYLGLSRRGPGGGEQDLSGVTHLVWPESAFPFLLTEDPRALGQIAELLPPGTTLVTGAVRADASGATEETRYHNSLYVITDEGEISATYDKTHLVPFGEYLPLQELLERIGLQQLTRIKGGFEAGRRRPAMTSSSAPPFGPLICYETIFPGEVLEGTGERPAWLLNLTNDAWFGQTIGPHQHLDQARLRSVEQGLPMARVANTGISAMIDPYGRILSALPLGAEGVVDTALPKALAAPPAARFPTLICAALLAAAAAAALAGARVPRF